mgnify:CR=1 FL=1
MLCLENDMDNAMFDFQEAKHYLEFNNSQRTFGIQQE